MLALFFTVFIDLVGFGIVLPLLPFYAQAFGATPDVVTLVAASFTLSQALFAPVWGRLSDRFGRRPILLITIFGTFCGYLWLAFSDTLLMVFLARAFGGAMAANLGVAHAYVADITPPDQRARGMGRVGAAAGLGFVAGPAIGGLLAGSDVANPDYQLPFFAAAAFSAVALFLAVIMLRETAESSQKSKTGAAGRQGMAAILLQPALVLLICLIFMTPFVFSGIETILAMWTERALAWGPKQNGYLYTYMGFVAVVVQGALIGPMTRLLGERRLIMLGATLVMIGAAGAPYSLGYGALFVTMGLIVFGVSISGPSLTSLISQHIGATQRGAILGVSQSSAGFGRILGPALSGTAFAGLGRDWPFFIGAMVMVLMLALSIGLKRYGGANRPPGPGSA